MGASAPPCGTSWLAHKRTLPLKAGPVSFKRLLGRKLKLKVAITTSVGIIT